MPRFKIVYLFILCLQCFRKDVRIARRRCYISEKHHLRIKKILFFFFNQRKEGAKCSTFYHFVILFNNCEVSSLTHTKNWFYLLFIFFFPPVDEIIEA